MTKTLPKTLLRDCALLVPVLVAVGHWLGGTEAALAVMVSGFVAVGNLVALWWVTARLVRATATGQGAIGASGLVFGKMMLIVALYGGLLGLFEARWVAVGLVVVIFGLAVRGVADALGEPSPELAEDV